MKYWNSLKNCMFRYHWINKNKLTQVCNKDLYGHYICLIRIWDYSARNKKNYQPFKIDFLCDLKIWKKKLIKSWFSLEHIPNHGQICMQYFQIVSFYQWLVCFFAPQGLIIVNQNIIFFFKMDKTGYVFFLIFSAFN